MKDVPDAKLEEYIVSWLNTFAILAIAWVPVAVAIVIGFGFFFGLLDDRAEKRSARHAAE